MSNRGMELQGVGKSFGSTAVIQDISVSIAPGEIVALLGPSGCGKTTTLRCMAGLETPDAGRITIDGRVVCDPAAGVLVATEDRNVGMMFQSYAIWPHMTIFDNVAFGLRVKKMAKAEVRARVTASLESVGLASKSERLPSTLSGGEQQRVALARSLVTQPTVLLMDEPLSNLDLKLRERMRVELRTMLKDLGATAVYVTHDQADAMVLADRLVIMNAGRIVEAGDPRTVYERPKTEFAAQFLGSANVIGFTRIVVEEGLSYGLLDGAPRLRLAGAVASLRHVVRPENIQMLRERPGDSMNAFECEVVESVFLGNLSYHTIRCGAQAFQVQSTGATWARGEKGWAFIPPAAIVPVID